MTTRGGRWVVALGLVGCAPAPEAMLPDDGAETGTPTPADTGMQEESSTGSDGEDESGSSETGLDETGDGSSTGSEPAECGNGIVEDGEGCDDDSAGCHSDCQRACTLALQVLGDGSGTYAAVAVDGSGVPQVAGTQVLEEDGDADAFIVSLDDALEEEQRRVFNTTESDELSRGITAHEGDELSVIRLREHFGLGGLGIDVTRVDGTSTLWTTYAGEQVGPTWAFFDAGATALPEGGVAVTSTYVGLEGVRNIWVGRFAADGSMSETVVEAISEPPRERGYEVTAGEDTLTIAGTRNSELGGLGVSDPLVVQIDGAGDVVWSWSEWTGATNLDLIPTGAATDGAGRTAVVFDQDHGTIPTHHALFMVFEPDGKVAWSLDTDDLDDDARHGGALAFDSTDRLFSFGGASSAAGGYSNRRPRVTAFDGEGQVLCDEALDEAGGDIEDAAFTPEGDIVAVGDWIDEGFDVHPAAFRIRGFP